MPFATVRRPLIAAALALPALSPGVRDALAGSVSVQFEVRARVVTAGATAPATPSTTPQCRGTVDPVTLACGSAAATTQTFLHPRSANTGWSTLDGWLTPGTRTDAYGSLYAASLTTRVVHFDDWEYVETLVSW